MFKFFTTDYVQWDRPIVTMVMPASLLINWYYISWNPDTWKLAFFVKTQCTGGWWMVRFPLPLILTVCLVQGQGHWPCLGTSHPGALLFPWVPHVDPGLMVSCHHPIWGDLSTPAFMNTDWNCLFNTSAFPLLSAISDLIPFPSSVLSLHYPF